MDSVKSSDYSLAISDIFGGNAFMPALFFVCDIVSGSAVLSHASSEDIWFAALGILLTTVYAIGLIIRPRKIYFRLGIDSLFFVLLYFGGMILLTFK